MRKPRNIACRNLKVLNELINTSESTLKPIIQTFKNLNILNFIVDVPINNNTSIVEFEIYTFIKNTQSYHIIKGNVKNLSATLNISIYDTYVSNSDLIDSYSITKNNNILNFEFDAVVNFETVDYISLQNANRTGGGYERFYDIGVSENGRLYFNKYDALGVVFEDEGGGTISPVIFDTPFDTELYGSVSFEFIDNTTSIRWYVLYSNYTYSPGSNDYLIFGGFQRAIKNYNEPNQSEETISALDDAIRDMEVSSKQSFEFINLSLRINSLVYYLKTKSYNI